MSSGVAPAPSTRGERRRKPPPPTTPPPARAPPAAAEASPATVLAGFSAASFAASVGGGTLGGHGAGHGQGGGASAAELTAARRASAEALDALRQRDIELEARRAALQQRRLSGENSSGSIVSGDDGLGGGGARSET